MPEFLVESPEPDMVRPIDVLFSAGISDPPSRRGLTDGIEVEIIRAGTFSAAKVPGIVAQIREVAK